MILPDGVGQHLEECIKKPAAQDTEYLLPGNNNAVIVWKAIQDNFPMIEDYRFNHH
jgi:hypothetical protein